MRKNNKTLKKNIVCRTTIFIALLCAILSILLFISLRKMMYSRYESYIEGILNYAQAEIDVEDLAGCIRTGEESEKYHELQNTLDKIKERMGIHYIYVVIPLNTEKNDNMKNVIAGATRYEYENEADELVKLNSLTGDSYSPDTAKLYLDAFNSGKLTFFEEISEWGEDYTGLLPLIGSDGKPVAALCVDVDITDIHSMLRKDIIIWDILIVMLGAGFIIMFLLWASRDVITPVEKLETAVVEYVSRCQDQKDPEALKFRNLDIHTRNEVETLARAIIRMSEAMQDYLEGMISAENAARLAEENVNLKESMYSLLNNIPGMSFSKDAETGIYLACNQAFAEYAGKTRPEEVVGLTDREIFDRETAIHFEEDDRLALSMDEPYVFMEDVPDAFGNERKLQTSKMKFFDSVGRLCTLGICSDVTDLVRIKRENMMTQEAYSRINALAGNFICIYIVDPLTGRYREYSITDGFEEYLLPKEGMDFFENVRETGRKHVAEEDLERFLSMFTRLSVISEIERSGIYMISFKTCINNMMKYVQLKAAMVDEPDGKKLVVGINDIDSYMQKEKEYEQQLENARKAAATDALTGVKSRHSYLSAEEELNRLISEKNAPEFAIVITDVNDLKKINDSIGHQAGDRYLKDACRIICNTFKHSPVYRVGGDEFAVIVKGNDYECIEELIDNLNRHNLETSRGNGIVIACGMARFEDDKYVAEIFERADADMYENKKKLKTGRD